ncbi:MAG: hypothetical protein ORN27_04880 [Rhodoluna sp.]|nr:hypothetical protein [Rhodoluna sp.]
MKEFRARRIAKILAAPTNRILDEPWVKRILSIVMIAGSYIYLAGLLIPYSNKDLVILKIMFGAGGLPWWMIVAFFLLRSSMRRITSLPDEYLDEREMELRDSSFKLGYLVVGRIGLALSGIVVLITSLGLAIYYFTPFSWTSTPRPTWYEALYKSINAYISDVFGTDPLLTLGSLVILLTYVAYSFPLIILAWRDARTVPEKAPIAPQVIVPKVELPEVSAQLAKTSKIYFRLLIGAVVSLPGAFGLVALMFVLPIFAMLAFAAFLFAPAVYVWAEIKLISTVQKLKKLGLAKSRTVQLLAMSIVAAIAGATIPSLYFIALSNPENVGNLFWVALGAGVVALGTHSAAFVTIRLTSLELVSDETTSS